MTLICEHLLLSKGGTDIDCVYWFFSALFMGDEKHSMEILALFHSIISC